MLLKDLSSASKNTTSLDTETRSLLSSSVFNARWHMIFSYHQVPREKEKSYRFHSWEKQ